MSRVAEVLAEVGGVGDRATLVALTSRAEVDAALRHGVVVRTGRGRYALPQLDGAVAAAHAVRGVLALTSAALWHGWEVKVVPKQPHVVVPRGRKSRGAPVQLHHAALLPEDVTDGICTSTEKTLEQCLRLLPEDEALAVADSALRHDVDPAVLRRLARSVRGHGAQQVRRVAARADPRAANPFESVLRHLAHQVPGLRVEPQRLIVGSRQRVHPDLVDVDLQLVLEADSFAWHGDRVALRRDARRYNLLVVDGWWVLRFAWEDVMHDPHYVLDVLGALVAGRTQLRHCPCCAA